MALKFLRMLSAHADRNHFGVQRGRKEAPFCSRVGMRQIRRESVTPFGAETRDLAQSPCKDVEGSLCPCSRLPWFECVPQLAIERRTCFRSVPRSDPPPVLDGGRFVLKERRWLAEQ